MFGYELTSTSTINTTRLSLSSLVLRSIHACLTSRPREKNTTNIVRPRKHYI